MTETYRCDEGSVEVISKSLLTVQGAPRLKVAIVGGGLAGLSTAVELLDQGHEVDIYESRPFIGGKVASFKDKDGNHIEVRDFAGRCAWD